MHKAKTSIDVIAIIVIATLTFGLQIPFLGFFQDDWNFVFYSSARGAQGLLEFLLVDGRPAASWVFILGFALLGYKPALWQFFCLFLRVLTVINFWMILRSLWPQRRYGNLIASIFFLAYPFFTLQPLSVSFAHHFVAYFLYSLSVLLMIRAVEKPDKYLLYSIPAVLSTFLHLFTVEYFVGLELLRPFIIWFIVYGREKIARREILRKVLIHWIPYLLVLAFFIAWRSLLSNSTGVRNHPFEALFDSGQIIFSTARNILADLVLMSVTSWFKLINPELFVIGPIRNFYLFATTLFGGLCFYFLAKPANASHEDDMSRDPKRIFLAGALIVAAGMISTYAAGYIVHLKIPPWNSRFALSSLMGLAMISAGLIEVVITSKNIRHVCFAILVGLLVGWHNQNTLNFKTAWEKQSRFYEQLMWRAPSIEPNTAIVANEEILTYMGDYPTSFGINTMYESKKVSGVPYWFFALSENFHFRADPIINGGQVHAQKATTIFQGEGQDAIFITYQQQCLWVLRPQDSEYKHLPAEMKKGALVSNYENILPEEKEHDLYNQIVKEDKDTWCYFYQKADLARQTGDWETVVTLWKEAENNGYRPDEGFEYIPFIEAYAHIDKWEDAFLLTKTANKTTEAMYFILCPTWERLAEETGPSEQKDTFVNRAYNLLNCAP
jgi:hypothetical protein